MISGHLGRLFIEPEAGCFLPVLSSAQDMFVYDFVGAASSADYLINSAQS